MEYRHTQKGHVVIVAMIVAIVWLLFQIGINGSLQIVPIVILIFLIAGLGLFYSLTVEIKNGILTCRFGPGLIQKNIPLSKIQSVRNVRNPWYAGWGIRWFPGRYWLWNISGFQAVELKTENGDRFRIGTDEPDALVQAIQIHKNKLL